MLALLVWLCVVYIILEISEFDNAFSNMSSDSEAYMILNCIINRNFKLYIFTLDS